jgi:probable F420-dependent oxidoreductase
VPCCPDPVDERERALHVELGLSIFPTREVLDPVAFAVAAEEAGFTRILLPEHTHIPTSRATPYPGGGELPPEYARTFDPFVALTAMACATRRIRIGTGVCLVVERDPIVTAKAVASLDVLSGGRFDFGVGAGWNREEMANHGTDPRTRMALLAERVEAMRAIWMSEEASYAGEHVAFDPIWSWPKPTQHPHPPILVGGWGPTVLDRVLAFGDAWLPTGMPPEALAPRIAELDERARAAGRDPIPVIVFGARPRAEALAAYAEAGVRACILLLPQEPPAEGLARIARYAELAGVVG